MDTSTAVFLAFAIPLAFILAVAYIIFAIVSKFTRGVVRSGRKTHAVIMNRPYTRR